MQRSSQTLLQAIQKLSTSRLCETAGILPGDVNRLLTKIEERSPDECWPWRGCRRNGGYGNWAGGDPRKNMYPHRIVLAIWLGRSLVHRALHKCDNRNCCNPHHLFEGTQAENIQDAVKKGRWQGRTNTGTKLSQNTASEIRGLLMAGEMSGAEIARKFGVSPSVIVGIGQGKIWTGVDRRFTHQASREVTDADVRRVYAETGSLKQAAAKLGLSTTTIWRRLQKTA